ncbi:MAG: leucine-rich repeat protein [Ruminococcus flavefaciens]|nr:leucine-rich repeat protein [Ruminococcus flavefaciens]MCM1363133.1 leucine-rich repeat protein [Clostridiales bacterium]MCM1436103.1 leucine-rich repeat protein [Ruminococcus flavefaciens]
MFKHKKVAAFILGLLISVSAVSPIYSAFAEGEEETSVTTEASGEESSEIIVSGEFSYSLTHDNTVCIEDCSSEEKNLVIPATIDGIVVTELGKLAFGNDIGKPYETITLPASIEYISSDNPFSVCDSLTAVIVDSSNENYIAEDGVLFTKDKSKLVCYPQKKTGSSYSIPEGVSVLGEASIYNTQLSEITFPSTLTEIQYYALGNNSKLTSADLSKTAVSSIGLYAFTDCSSLSNVLLPDSLYEIAGAAFSRCKALNEITLPKNLGMIGQYAFIDTGLSKITVPDSVSEIGYSAFGYYLDSEGNETADSNFVIVGSYGSAAQRYATDKDTEYDYANSFEFRVPEQDEQITEQLSLEKRVFGDYEYAVVNGDAVITACTSDEAVLNIPSEIEGLTVIAVYPVAFTNCLSEEIILPETVTYIREMSFYSCANLKKITLPSSLTEIGNNAFDNCTLLETIDTGGAVTIGQNVFLDCPSLKNLTISGNCTSIGAEDEEPFLYCTALESVTVTSGDGIYSSENGVLFNKDKSTIILYPQAKTDKKYKAPKSVKEIGQSAFYHCKYLETADISGVEVLKDYAFEGCEKLKKVKLSKNLTQIGADAFYGCKALTSLRFYDKLTYIGEGAFGECYNENADTDNIDPEITGTDESEPHDMLIEGFKIYADKESMAYEYAEKRNIPIVSGTVLFLGLNIHKGILFGGAGVIAALIAAFITKFIVSKSKKKKSENKQKEDKKDEE